MNPNLEIEVEPGQLRETSLQAYLVRFVFGGTVTAVAGLIAHFYGPVVGGLFLAFPGILPTSVTLIERHDGRRAAGAGADGPAFGAIGLLAFGGVVWWQAERLPAWLVLSAATLAWIIVSVVLWVIARTIRRLHRANPPGYERGQKEIRAGS